MFLTKICTESSQSQADEDEEMDEMLLERIVEYGGRVRTWCCLGVRGEVEVGEEIGADGEATGAAGGYK